MNSEVAWVLVSSGTQVQPQIILDSDYLPDYLSVFYGLEYKNRKKSFYSCKWNNHDYNSYKEHVRL